MSKKAQRWPRWKIALAAIVCTAAAVALFVLSSLAGVTGDAIVDDDSAAPMLTVPTFLLMMGVAASMLAVLAYGWLIYRIREDRIPAWERADRGKRKKRRRR